MAQAFRLIHSELISPRWFNQVRYGSRRTTVLPDGSVNLEGVLLNFENEPLAPGTEIEVSLDRWFYCQKVADIEADRAEAVHRKAMEDAEHRAKLNQWRDEALAANAEVKLPVEWVPGIKDVLSGLSFNSMGNGRNRRTVQHIMLKDDLNLPRLKRNKGDFLCSSSPRMNGKRWSTTEEYFHDGDNKPYPAPITCKACLRLTTVISK